MLELILALKKAYGIGLPLRFLPSLESLSSNEAEVFQNRLAEEIILSPRFQEYPPAYESRLAFWKYIVQEIEKIGEEVDERIYNECIQLLSNKPTVNQVTPPVPSYRTHFWNVDPSNMTQENTHQTTLLESRTMIESGTTGLCTWGASLALADWLLAHPNVVRNHRVLELGSGTGFLGLIIAELQRTSQDLGNTSLTLTDVNLEVLERCSKNFQLNQLSGYPSIAFRLLDWHDALIDNSNSDFPIHYLFSDIDTIVGADLVYDVSIIPALAAVIGLFLRLKYDSKLSPQEPACVSLALTVRRAQTIVEFNEALESQSLKYTEEDISMPEHKQFLRGQRDIGCPITLYRIHHP